MSVILFPQIDVKFPEAWTFYSISSECMVIQ